MKSVNILILKGSLLLLFDLPKTERFLIISEDENTDYDDVDTKQSVGSIRGRFHHEIPFHTID